MMEEAAVVVEAERQRAHPPAPGLVAEPADDTVGSAQMLDFQHGAFSRQVGEGPGASPSPRRCGNRPPGGGHPHVEPLDNAGNPIDADYGRVRSQFKCVVEMMQIKGNCEVTAGVKIGLGHRPCVRRGIRELQAPVSDGAAKGNRIAPMRQVVFVRQPIPVGPEYWCHPRASRNGGVSPPPPASQNGELKDLFPWVKNILQCSIKPARPLVFL